MTQQSLTYVEIDIPAFSGSSPDTIATYRFARDATYLPTDIDCIPSIVAVDITPATIRLGEDIGTRGSITVRFRDHKHVFAAESFDSGTFWGKFRARYGLTLRGYSLRLITGYVGQALASMETRHFIIEASDGPTFKGEYQIIAKDVLKLADSDRALAPALSNGFLSAAITETDRTITLSPTNVNTEYPAEGYASIGGNENVYYHKDSATTMLLNFEGADGAVTTTDTATLDRVITFNGNAQIDTAQAPGGGASSLLLDGTTDSISIAPAQHYGSFNFGTGDATIEFFLRRPAVSIADTFFDFRSAEPQVAILLIAATDNSFRLFVNGALRITGAAGTLTANTNQHLAWSRVSGTSRLFVGGVQTGANFADANDYAHGNEVFIGARFDGTESVSGWIDGVRVSKSGRYSANFTPPSTPIALSTSASDTWRLSQRGLFGTEAADHDAESRIQEALIYTADSPADIINDLLVNYASVDSSFIPLSDWQTEITNYLNTVYTAHIAEPTSVKTLISELIEQAALGLWWDDVNEQIRLQVLRAIATTTDTYNEDVIMRGSLDVQEQPERRVSRVIVYFGKVNPLRPNDEEANYLSSATVIDAQAEADYGGQAIKEIHSRWIPAGGRTVAETLAQKQIDRFRDPPRRLSFELMRYSTTQNPQLGGGYQVGSWPFQSITGTAVNIPVQITRLRPDSDSFKIEAEEMLFSGEDTDPLIRNIVFDVNEFNINLRTRHDLLYATPQSGDTVNATINTGVIIGSSITSTAAFDVGSWPAGVTVNVIVKGRIQGAGGRGGNADQGVAGAGEAGQAGGIALLVARAITLTLNTGAGEIWGGGGGGGGTDFDHPSGGGGGGGAGHNPGAGGLGQIGEVNPTTDGQPGSTSAGGAGGNGSVNDGGAGGGPGLAGSAAAGSGAGAGGSAGGAISGVSFVTKVGTGDIRGTETG